MALILEQYSSDYVLSNTKGESNYYFLQRYQSDSSKGLTVCVLDNSLQEELHEWPSFTI